MVNCRMMSEDWRNLTLWQYQAMLSEWNDRHTPDDGKGKPLDPERKARLRRAMEANTLH